jgi:hypothetical protein
MTEVLNATTLEDLIERQKQKFAEAPEACMYYI